MNAMVNVPLSDIDKLRDEVKLYKEKSEELEKKEKQVKVIVELKSWGVGPTLLRDNRGRSYMGKGMIEKYDPISTKYIGLEEVTKILREEEEEKVANKLKSLDYDLKKQKELHQDEIEKKEKEILELKGQKIDKDKDQEIKYLQQKNINLEADIYRLKRSVWNLEDIIDKKKDRLHELLSRNWYQRLFNLK